MRISELSQKFVPVGVKSTVAKEAESKENK
jgi:hypothetical protein